MKISKYAIVTRVNNPSDTYSSTKGFLEGQIDKPIALLDKVYLYRNDKNTLSVCLAIYRDKDGETKVILREDDGEELTATHMIEITHSTAHELLALSSDGGETK